MSETSDQNGTAPAPADEPCLDCATPGEKALAVLAFLLGAFVIVMAIDMFNGGRIGGWVKDQAASQ